MSNLIKIFARREPTIDSVAVAHGMKDKCDVVFYRDAEATQKIARWTWHQSPPRRGRAEVTLNCWTWALAWLPDVPRKSSSGILAGA